MILNQFEKIMMNNPVRALIQKTYEAGKLLHMGSRVPSGGHALEVGCGRGVGTEIILTRFGAKTVDAFDLDADMVRRARQRLRRRGARVRLWCGDVTCIPRESETYDAVFDFGIIHHVPDWRSAIREIHRVLKPGGRFYCEEIFRDFIDFPIWRILLDHPRTDRFDFHEFSSELVARGFLVKAADCLFQQAGWYIADKPSD